MIDQNKVKPIDSVEELLRFIGIGRTEAKKIKEEEILAEFTERLKKEGYSISLINEFTGRLRAKGYAPNYIAGAIAVLLGRRAEEAEKEYTLERLIKLTEKLPANVGKSVAKELTEVSLYTTSRTWASVLMVPLHDARPSPEQIGYYPQGADCVVYLPDSTGQATIRLDSATAHGYGIGTKYRKVRHPFHNLYIENTAQDGCYLYLLISKGGIDMQAMEHKAASPAIYNVTMAVANREYSQALPANTKRFLIQTRDQSAFRLAFESGHVATPTEPYLTVTTQPYPEEDVKPSQLTLYFASGSTGKVIEIVTWT